MRRANRRLGACAPSLSLGRLRRAASHELTLREGRERVVPRNQRGGGGVRDGKLEARRTQWLAATAAPLVLGIRSGPRRVALPCTGTRQRCRRARSGRSASVRTRRPRGGLTICVSVLDGPRPEDIGAGPVLCCPFSSSRLSSRSCPCPTLMSWSSSACCASLHRTPRSSIRWSLRTGVAHAWATHRCAWRFALTWPTASVAPGRGLPIELARGAVLCFARASVHEMAS
jgi:hypothetical protein